MQLLMVTFNLVMYTRQIAMLAPFDNYDEKVSSSTFFPSFLNHRELVIRENLNFRIELMDHLRCCNELMRMHISLIFLQILGLVPYLTLQI